VRLVEILIIIILCVDSFEYPVEYSNHSEVHVLCWITFCNNSMAKVYETF
jgi:hypothetical protein